MRRGRLDAALHEVETACTKYRARAEWAARCRVQKAHVLFLRGSYNDALALLATDLPAPLAHTEVAVQRKMVQGLAHAYLQEYEQAEASLTEAETLERSVDSSFRGDVSQARGILETDLKRYVEANIAFRKALTIARERNLPFLEAQALGNIGYVAMRQERYDEAIDWFRLTLEKSRSIGSLSSSLRTLGNMGWNYSVVGDFENAEASLKEARAKAEEAGLIDEQIYWLNSLADIYARQHRYAEADSAARQAVLLAEKNDDQDTLTTCLNTRSEIAIAMGHLDDAEKSNRRATEIENAGLDHFGINRSQLIAGRIEAGKHENQKAEALFRKVLADAKAETPLKWEAHARLAQVYAGQHQPAKAEREFHVAIGTVEKARNSVQRDEFKVSFLTSAIEFYDDYVNFLIEQKRSLDALKIADLSRTQSLDQSLSSANVRPSVSTPSSSFQDAARRLNATLLYYWLGQEKSWLWAITPTETFLFPLPASPEIDSALKAYRDSFTGPRDPLEARNADGKKLYATLIQPVEKIIPKNSRVVILPDGSLNSLNFETLITSGAQPRYWIEDVTLLTANSLSVFARGSVPAPSKQANLLLVGDALAASPDFPPLPQAGKEIGLLKNYFSSSQRVELIGKNATATRFLSSEPEKFAYLHFATHGTASRLRPLESAVILSPEGDSYKLYAREVVKHPLNAYLVTISACNGAGTKSYAGEGLVGLSWAFLRAGAHNVIAGLWEVSNASTPQLMDELYKGIHAGEDPATALRNAKLTLLHSSGNYRKPFYWAPFQLYLGS